jgi:hypothetical protein
MNTAFHVRYGMKKDIKQDFLVFRRHAPHARPGNRRRGTSTSMKCVDVSINPKNFNREGDFFEERDSEPQ